MKQKTVLKIYARKAICKIIMSNIFIHITDDVGAELQKFFKREFKQDSFNKIGEGRKPFAAEIVREELICGGISGYTQGVNGYIGKLIISSQEQGAGLGKKAIRTAEEICRSRGATKIWVDTLSYQAPTFYEALGYERVNRVDGFYEDHDRLFYCKDLSIKDKPLEHKED